MTHRELVEEREGWSVYIEVDVDPQSPVEWGIQEQVLYIEHADLHYTDGGPDPVYCMKWGEMYWTPEYHCFDLSYSEDAIQYQEMHEDWQENQERNWKLFPVCYSAPRHELFFCEFGDHDGFIMIKDVYTDLQKLARVAEGKPLISPKSEAEACLETWNEYLTGDVWWYEVLDPDGESVDSCSGVYGYENAIEQARQALAYEINREKKRGTK